MKAKIFFPSLAFVLTLGIFLNFQQISRQEQKSLEAKQDYFLKNEIDPKDAWLYEIIEPTSDINPEDVYTFECELRAKRPELISTTCADLGLAIWNIEWESWSALGAYGEGVYRENDCEPNCAEGTISKIPATVELADLVFDGERYYFTTAKIRLKDESYSGEDLEFVWDVADFYREVPGMRSDTILED